MKDIVDSKRQFVADSRYFRQFLGARLTHTLYPTKMLEQGLTTFWS